MPHVHNGLHHYTALLSAAARAVGEVSGAQDFSGIERFGETLTPVINLFDLPEWALLRGERMFSRSVTSVAVALRTSSIELVNPATSGVIAVVSFVRALSGSTTFNLALEDGISIAANPLTSRGCTNDGRFQKGEISRCTLVTGDLAAGIALPQDQITNLEVCQMPWVVTPGTKLFMIGAVNSVIGAACFWTERELLPNESRA